MGRWAVEGAPGAPSRYQSWGGRWREVASQFRWTSKSVDRYSWEAGAVARRTFRAVTARRNRRYARRAGDPAAAAAGAMGSWGPPQQGNNGRQK